MYLARIVVRLPRAVRLVLAPTLAITRAVKTCIHSDATEIKLFHAHIGVVLDDEAVCQTTCYVIRFI